MGESGTGWETERRALMKLREELTALLTASAEGSRPVDLDEPIVRISRVDAMQQQKMVAVNRQSAQQRRRQVEAAAWIASGNDAWDRTRVSSSPRSSSMT